MINQKLIDKYKDNFKYIKGWLDVRFLEELFNLNEVHEQNNIKGNILEIGVYFGKTFIPLSFLLKDNEAIIGIDCFEDQEINISQSGMKCSQRLVKHNIKKIYFDEIKHLNFKLIKSDSTTLNANNYINFTNNTLLYRIIYIDGGHDENTCSIDLNNSANILCKYGYIIIDDYQNYFKDIGSEAIHGEGVTKAVDKFLLQNKNFEITKKIYNKLIVIKN